MVLALTAIDLLASRWPPFFDKLITLRVKPHLVQSLLAAVWLTKEGMLDPALRELRFLLEASVKTLSLDRGSPTTVSAKRDSLQGVKVGDVADKVVLLDDLGRKRFRKIVDGIEFQLLNRTSTKIYRQTAKDLYSKLSTLNHISSVSVMRDLVDFDRGRGFGFETVDNIDSVARLAKRVLDRGYHASSAKASRSPSLWSMKAWIVSVASTMHAERETTIERRRKRACQCRVRALWRSMPSVCVLPTMCLPTGKTS